MVDRYRPRMTDDPYADCELSSEGDYVLFLDYEKIQQQNAELQSEVERLKDTIIHLAAIRETEEE